jgi:RimJ/RimL family protein N-acetyltransferase
MKTFERIIYDGERAIGNICILMYPEIERWFLQYDIEPEYRNQGVMSHELPLFLQECRDKGFNQICAMVKKDNLPSIKLLEKNGFVEFERFRDTFTYIIDLRVNKEETLEMIKMFKELRNA